MSATTLLGRKKVEDLGFICAHEHLRMNFECSFHKSKLCSEDTNMKLKNMTNHQAAMVRQFPYHFKDNLDLTDYEAVLYDLKDYKKLGGGTICEVSTVGLSRDPKFCAKLSEESGVNVIMGTGYYVHAAQTDATKASTVEVMNQFIQNELKNGFTECPGELYPGLVGEMGCSWPITEWERRHLQAAGMLHEQPGFETAPISIHPGRNEKAPEEIVRILTEAGGKEEKIVMGHLDRTIHEVEKLAEFGDQFKNVVFEFDLFGIENSHYQMAPVFMPNDGERLRRIKGLIDLGCSDRIVLGQDIHTSHRLLKNGGHGYGHLLRVVQDQALNVAQISPEIWEKMTKINPQRILTIDIQ